jgi:hypothetical protein
MRARSRSRTEKVAHGVMYYLPTNQSVYIVYTSYKEPSMIRVSHSQLYTISGLVWLMIGAFLLNLGLGLITKGFTSSLFAFEGYSPFFVWVAASMNGFENAALLFIIAALLLGYFKGRLVLHKVALESGSRIASLENPTTLSRLYAKKNLIVMGSMILLGALFRYFGVPHDFRGFFATAVGTALLQGSLTFFQLARKVKI